MSDTEHETQSPYGATGRTWLPLGVARGGPLPSNGCDAHKWRTFIKCLSQGGTEVLCPGPTSQPLPGNVQQGCTTVH
jgi:hypothetical protein